MNKYVWEMKKVEKRIPEQIDCGHDEKKHLSRENTKGGEGGPSDVELE